VGLVILYGFSSTFDCLIMNPFDYVNAILQNKKQLIVDELTEKEYNPFLTNRSLSYHKDCIMYANEMNSRHFLDKKLQNDFLLNTVRSQKRPFAKWVKSEKSEDIECIKTVYGFSETKAREALLLLSKEQIQQLKEQTYTGGLGK
jgi:hypothetical protein